MFLPGVVTEHIHTNVFLVTTGKSSFYVILLFKNLVKLLLTKESFFWGAQNPNMMKGVVPFPVIMTT